MKRAYAAYWQVLALLPTEARRFLSFYSIALGLLSILDALSLGLLAVVITPLIAGTPMDLPLVGRVEGFGLIVVLGLVCALIILKGVLSLLLTWFATRRFAKYELEIGNQLLDAYLQSSWAARLRRNSSDLIRVADLGIANTIGGFLLPGATLPGEALTFITVVIVLAIVQPLIAIITLIYLGIVGFVMFYWISRRAHEAGVVGMRSSFTVSRLITEMVGALKEITLSNKADEVATVVRENQGAHRTRAGKHLLPRQRATLCSRGGSGRRFRPRRSRGIPDRRVDLRGHRHLVVRAGRIPDDAVDPTIPGSDHSGNQQSPARGRGDRRHPIVGGDPARGRDRGIRSNSRRTRAR